MATKKKLTERQRFERWHKRVFGWLADDDSYPTPYWAQEERWFVWQASARVKR